MPTRSSRLRAAAQRCLHGLRRGLARVAAVLAAPAFVIIVLLLAGSGCAVAGVALLQGTAWALITAAVILFLLAGLLLRGVANA